MVKHVYDNYQELKVGRNHVKGWISVFFPPQSLGRPSITGPGPQAAPLLVRGWHD